MCAPAYRVAVGPDQFGVQVPAGAECMTRLVQARARARQGDAFIALDFKNAYGAVGRSGALRLTAARVPAAAGILANLWRPGVLQACVRQRLGEVHVIDLHDGLLQGEILASPSFALRLCEELEATAQEAPPGDLSLLVAHADDVVLASPPARAPAIVRLLDGRLRRAGLQREPTKGGGLGSRVG